MSEVRDTRLQIWGRLGYRESLARQQRLREDRIAGRVGDVVVAVEHPPTITLGRHAPDSDIVCDPAELAGRHIELVRTERGGRATYHGPGQVVLYPIVAIGELGLGVRNWISLLEDTVIETLGEFAIEGATHRGSPGVWTRGGKIASIGLRLVRGVSSHGVALNVNLDVQGFDYIVTCGVANERVTTMAAECAAAPAVETVRTRLSANLISKLDARRGAKT